METERPILQKIVSTHDRRIFSVNVNCLLRLYDSGAIKLPSQLDPRAPPRGRCGWCGCN